MHIELKSFLTGKNNKIASARCNRTYFEKMGKLYLWEYIQNHTAEIKSLTLKEKIWFAVNHTMPNSCKTCGRPAGVDFSGYIARKRIYCCRECQYSDPNLGSLIKERKKKTDQRKATEKRKATMLTKFGAETSFQRPEVKQKLGRISRDRQISKEVQERLDDRDWIYHQYITLDKPSTIIAKELGGIYYGTVLEAVRKHNLDVRTGANTYDERMLYEFIRENIDEEIITRARNVIDGELDIYIPSLNLAFEYNGLFYHSIGAVIRGNKDKNYHLNKTEQCEHLGIQLIHINSDVWNNKQHKIKSFILSKLNKYEKIIYARNTVLRKLDNSAQRDFFENNHLQGAVNSTIAYGLYDENEQLVYAISFGCPRFNKHYDWEVLRLSSLLNTKVIGGASKIIKHFMNNHSGSIVSYCDRQISVGKIYETIGFKHVRNTPVGYYWTDSERLYHRTKFMKHKLKDQLKYYDEGLSEADNMYNNRYRKYYDCGQRVYEIKNRA